MQSVTSISLSRCITRLLGRYPVITQYLHSIPNAYLPTYTVAYMINVSCSKMDMLSGDLHMKNEVSISNGRKKGGPRCKVDATEMAFHFNTFVPIDGTLWKLDGLERRPQSLGKPLTNVASTGVDRS